MAVATSQTRGAKDEADQIREEAQGPFFGASRLPEYESGPLPQRITETRTGQQQCALTP